MNPPTAQLCPVAGTCDPIRPSQPVSRTGARVAQDLPRGPLCLIGAGRECDRRLMAHGSRHTNA